MNKILITVLIAIVGIFLLKKKGDAQSIPESDDNKKEPQPVKNPPETSPTNPVNPEKNGSRVGEDPITGDPLSVFIEQKNVDELTLKNLIDWFLANKEKASQKQGNYRGIIIKDDGKAKYKQFSYRGNSNKPALNRVLVGFFNDRDEIDEDQPIAIYTSKTISGDLRSQFGDNDLIILT